MVHCLRETGPDQGGDKDMDWSKGSEHLLPRRPVTALSRTSVMLSSVKTE